MTNNEGTEAAEAAPGSGNEVFASVLRTLRALRSLSQVRLAELSGIDRSMLHRLESGSAVPSEEQCALLAKALTLPEIYLQTARVTGVVENERLRNPQIETHLKTVFSVRVPIEATEASEPTGEYDLAATLAKLPTSTEPAPTRTIASNQKGAPGLVKAAVPVETRRTNR
jgi:transcriptional regulator with XRE-family HTH domain